MLFKVLMSVFSATTESNRNATLNVCSIMYSLKKTTPKYFKVYLQSHLQCNGNTFYLTVLIV